MAIILKDYSKTKHTGLKIHKSGEKFLFDVMIDGNRFRKTYKASHSHSKGDRLKTAYNELELFIKTKTKELYIMGDMEATVNDYYLSLKASNKWSEKTTDNYNGVYDKYIRNVLGKKKIVEVNPPMFTQLNSTIKHLAKGSQKKLYDILIPLFKLAKEDEIISEIPIKNSHIPKRNQLSEKKVIINV